MTIDNIILHMSPLPHVDREERMTPLPPNQPPVRSVASPGEENTQRDVGKVTIISSTCSTTAPSHGGWASSHQRPETNARNEETNAALRRPNSLCIQLRCPTAPRGIPSPKPNQKKDSRNPRRAVVTDGQTWSHSLVHSRCCPGTHRQSPCSRRMQRRPARHSPSTCRPREQDTAIW